MAHDPHDVGLPALPINGVPHGLAIDGQGLVDGTMPGGPPLQGPIEGLRIDADQHIADDRFAGHHIAAVFAPAPEALPGLGAQTLGPARHGLIPAHATQRGPGRDGQHHRQPMAPALGLPRIGDVPKALG